MTRVVVLIAVALLAALVLSSLVVYRNSRRGDRP
jgi:type II secretory pathway pseudopilin PulG